MEPTNSGDSGQPAEPFSYGTGQINSHGRAICGAKTKNSEDRHPCRATALGPNGRCMVHGGTRKVGPAHPNYKHGRQSKLMSALPRNLQQLAEQSRTDPTRLEMNNELAILQAMLYKSVQQWDGGGDIWRGIKQTWESYRSAARHGNVAGMQAGIERLEELCERGYADYLARAETRDIIQDIRRVSESERKRMIDAELMLSVDKVTLLMGQVVDVILSEVKDPDTLAALHRRFALLLAEHRTSTALQIAS
jgi:hypothetical protein